jgi:hypothetical protein
VLATLLWAIWLAPAAAFAVPERGLRPRFRLDVGVRLLGVPSGRWNLEQKTFGVGLTFLPVGWLALQSAVEASSTELTARRLDADPFQVRTRMDAARTWGFSHAISVRTHLFRPGRLEAFGEIRWMPGYDSLRILELILDPGRMNLSSFGRLDSLLRARFAWWQAAAGARVGCKLGPLDMWLDGGAMWARIALHWALSDRAMALGRMAAPDQNMDGDGNFIIHEEKPFARFGLRLDLPGPFFLNCSGIAVPTSHGMAHGLTLGASWTP